MNCKVSRYLVFFDVDTLIAKRYVLFSTRTGAVFVLQEAEVDQLNRADWSVMDENLLHQLRSAEILVPEEEDEKNRILQSAQRPWTVDSTWSLCPRGRASCPAPTAVNGTPGAT